MNFKIEIEGLDDVFRSLTDLESGESKTSFIGWANRVEVVAKQFCHHEKSKRIKFKHTDKTGIDFDFTDKKDIDCVLRAIEHLNDAMPAFLKGFYKRVGDVLTAKRIEFT